ncbi:3D-(3,5/4)-trihydroxycyclohexane-1,2-dione acylhydrolase (decyclizing) [[Enterobacter] lignolyticus]|uniref:3D-(3,5/4)-trihydroxycyclohexane-1,2-dione acylhydrolase (Decyclizing) n=1 Tax=[Enterobacter] lignolyticus TaxID=1334193 RepID=A0A806X7N4_9ENTR|nr:3D-(3,5/4)-trihydroxycyclohexane-1,2-dione acylhydrolase (decyclizing) [[Enterobacter] lignolyticus]ALR78120.1 3D-(3,5/4)-trihydroxycyclohexane-1,2-dione acylhydrolase (decyclizing) [[Enterobacter] lignolyticus]
MSTIRLTMAQALVRYLAAQWVEIDGERHPLFAGCFAIFGHGNVAGVGEALYEQRERFPTWRAHNEQGMAHAAIAFAKAHFRRRMMAVTTSIGPGATNLVTAAALAHVNRLPVLLLPGDVFVSRAPDPVLQQLEDVADGCVSVNDSLRPVSRYFDRITRPEQLLTALPRAIAMLTDPAQCGPVTLALPQDVQTEAWDYPLEFFNEQQARFRCIPAVDDELAEAITAIRQAKKPLIVSGGGVLYAGAGDALRRFAEHFGVPVCETQAGKSALPWDHELQLGAVGVTGSPAANELAAEADLVLAVGTRLQDFTTGSHSLFCQAKLLSVNVNNFDALKWRGQALVADACRALNQLTEQLNSSWQASPQWTERARRLSQGWRETVHGITNRREPPAADQLPYDAEVIGAVQRSHPDSATHDIVVCAAGTLPAELHKLWRAGKAGSYHMEYGYSCMGYEVAGGLGVKMAHPEREVIVMVGDGSYLMMNSELATSVMLGQKLIVVLLDNRGYGCINRLQQACGGEPFNNMLENCLTGPQGLAEIDFAKHAEALGARAEHVADIAGLEAAMQRARQSDRSYMVVIDTDARRTTQEGGCWWEVAVPQVSQRPQVRAARAGYEAARKKQAL